MTPQQKTAYKEICQKAFELRLQIAELAEGMCTIVDELELGGADRKEVMRLTRATRGLLRADGNLSRVRVI